MKQGYLVLNKFWHVIIPKTDNLLRSNEEYFFLQSKFRNQELQALTWKNGSIDWNLQFWKFRFWMLHIVKTVKTLSYMSLSRLTNFIFLFHSINILTPYLPYTHCHPPQVYIYSILFNRSIKYTSSIIPNQPKKNPKNNLPRW